jgi:MFS family permease
MATSEQAGKTTAWAPLRRRQFRALWAAQMASNFGTWMQNVGAAWLMTRLGPSPLMVALVQSATSLPVFLVALPAGAIADLVDRRRLLLFTQTWMLAAAGVLGVLTLSGATTPAILLGLTFALGLGSAMNGPGWQATVSELVPLEELTPAVALNSLSFNVARALGPALGGLVVLLAGSGMTFLLNAVSFLGVIVVLYLWRRKPADSVLPMERMLSAMKAAGRYVRHAPPVKAVLAREAAFVFCAAALWALLPVVAASELKTRAVGYGVLLGFIGAGAVCGATLYTAVRRAFRADVVAAAGSLMFGMGTLALAQVRVFALLCGAMFIAGMAWTWTMSSFNVTAQTSAPAWVRARVLATYLFTFQGGLAAGSAAWGALATRLGLSTALCAAGLGLAAGLLLMLRYRLAETTPPDVEPSLHWPEPALAVEPEPHHGPVLITVEYRVVPENAGLFREAMREMARIRRRDGAVDWGLYHDAADPNRYIETFVLDSWVEHMRQHARMTVSDRAIEERARALASAPPKVSHFLYAYQPEARYNNRGK